MDRPNKLRSPSMDSSDESTHFFPSANFRNTHFAAFSALLYIVVMGMVSSYSAPATVDMKKPGSRFKDITAEEITWIASINLITGVVGNCLSGYISQILGRKAVLIYISSLYVTSWLIIAYAPSVYVVLLGRFLCGFSSGICFVTVPAYVVEISPVEIRGLLTAGFQVAFSLGVLIVMSLGIVLRWSWLAISGASIIALGACLMLFMPESPPWLLREDRTVEAIGGIKFLKGKYVDTDKEIQEIYANLSGQSKERITLKEFFDPSLYKPVAIAVLLMAFQQFSGISSLMSYTVAIFEETGTTLDPNIAATIVAAVQLVCTAASSFLMDRAGRRLLFMTSGTFVALSLFVFGMYHFLIEKYGMNLDYISWLPVVSLVLCVAFFSIGFGPIPLVMAPEMVPIRYRGLILAFTSVSSSFLSFVVTKSYVGMKELCGEFGLYWIYASCSLLGVFFCWFCVPETKGKAIHEIHRSFSLPNNEL